MALSLIALKSAITRYYNNSVYNSTESASY